MILHLMQSNKNTFSHQKLIFHQSQDTTQTTIEHIQPPKTHISSKLRYLDNHRIHLATQNSISSKLGYLGNLNTITHLKLIFMHNQDTQGTIEHFQPPKTHISSKLEYLGTHRTQLATQNSYLCTIMHKSRDIISIIKRNEPPIHRNTRINTRPLAKKTKTHA